MPHAQNVQMTGYYMEKFLEMMQREFLYDNEKCLRISQIEILFMNLLEWDDMKYFHHIIKKSPELFAQLVAGLYKRDHGPKEGRKTDEQYWHNMYTVYDKAHFCPAEENGEVKEEKLRRGVYSPSAGKEEMRMAEAFKANAEYLAPGYPKTAKIFYSLYDRYRRESQRARQEAEERISDCVADVILKPAKTKFKVVGD